MSDIRAFFCGDHGIRLVGMIIAVTTCSSASTSAGTYCVCWGTIIFGAIRFLQGLFRSVSVKA